MHLRNPGNLDDLVMILRWRNRQPSNLSLFMPMMSTLLLMGPAASLLGTSLYLTQMIRGATLTILVVAPPMIGAPSVTSPLPLRLSQRHLRRMSPLL